MNQPAPWVSNIAIMPKADGSPRFTLEARNINKAIIPANQRIPRHEDIKKHINSLVACYFRKWVSNKLFGKVS